MQLGYQDIGTYNNSVPTHGLVPKGSVAPENAGSRMCGVTVCCESGKNFRLILRHFYIYTIQTLSSQIFSVFAVWLIYDVILKSLQWLLTSDTIVPYSNSFICFVDAFKGSARLYHTLPFNLGDWSSYGAKFHVYLKISEALTSKSDIPSGK